MTRSDWKLVREFNDDRAEVGVHVYATEVPPRIPPRDPSTYIPMHHYCLRIVRVSMGKAHNFFPIVGIITNGVVQCVPFPTEAMARLAIEAHAWIVAERQDRTDRIYAMQEQKSGSNSFVPRAKTVNER